MQVFIKGLEGKTITINGIEPTSTVFELKKKCYERMSIELENQRLLYANKQLENDRTLEFYEIGDRSTLQLTIRISGGGFGFQQFQDLTKPTILRPWGDAPDWRIAVGGLSLEGYCKNSSCRASNSKVLVRWGYKDFDFIQDEHESKCPICSQYVTPTSCGFNNTFWKFKGLKKVDGKSPEWVDSDWKFAPNTGFTTFGSEDLVIWRELVIQVKRP